MTVFPQLSIPTESTSGIAAHGALHAVRTLMLAGIRTIPGTKYQPIGPLFKTESLSENELLYLFLRLFFLFIQESSCGRRRSASGCWYIRSEGLQKNH